MGRLGSFAGLTYFSDTTDPANGKLYGDVQTKITEFSGHLLFFALELNRIDDAVIDASMANDSAAGHYRPWLVDLRKDKPYQLDDRLEQLFLEKSMTSAAAFNRLFDETMVSWFVKQALVNLANDTGLKFDEPDQHDREGWAKLMKKLGVKGVHIAERDTQRTKHPKPLNVFWNTWSVEGFISEGLQPAELGWGTHEAWMPKNAKKHKHGSQAAIYLEQPGANTRVRTWRSSRRWCAVSCLAGPEGGEASVRKTVGKTLR